MEGDAALVQGDGALQGAEVAARTAAIPEGAEVPRPAAPNGHGTHGTVLGGVIVESGKFPWDNGRHPGMTEPSAGYHGVRWYETFGDFGFTMKARTVALRDFGPAMAPMT